MLLEKAVQAAKDLPQQSLVDRLDGVEPAATGAKFAALDSCCLDLCISLLDHELKGDLFESVAVGFFTVSAINVRKGIFKEAYKHTSVLSGFVKIAQLLVLQKAVVAADRGGIDYPADVPNGMRERLLVHGTRSPFNWASRFRMYAKKSP